MGKVIDKGSLRPGDGIPLGGPMIVPVRHWKRPIETSKSEKPLARQETPQNLPSSQVKSAKS